MDNLNINSVDFADLVMDCVNANADSSYPLQNLLMGFNEFDSVLNFIASWCECRQYYKEEEAVEYAKLLPDKLISYAKVLKGRTWCEEHEIFNRGECLICRAEKREEEEYYNSFYDDDIYNNEYEDGYYDY